MKPTYSVQWLKDQVEKGMNPDFLFFWGHTPKPGETIGKFIFSQWWPAAFVYEEKTYLTAEHWMMEKKALLFGDKEIAQKVLAAKHPKAAKDLGREVRNFDPAAWDENKYKIVTEGNLHKFSQHPELKDYLLKTGSKILVEASPLDAIWGIGLAEDHKNASDVFAWRGENLLGFALMEVRDMLR